MPTGAITDHIDVAQVVLYAFWIFFFGLVIYLRREDRREGYPLISDNGQPEAPSFVGVPSPKTFLLRDGRTVSVPNDRADKRPIKAVASAAWPGSPLIPTGNPMLDGVGPASYAERADIPDMSLEGHPRIVPLRIANELYIEETDPDPRGMTVYGADGRVAGTVRDVWVDRTEYLARYLEVDLGGAAASDDEESASTAMNTVLLPMTLANVNGRTRRVHVASLLASQFSQVPRTRSASQVTLLEEEKIMAYYGGGILYAEPSRSEPMI